MRKVVYIADYTNLVVIRTLSSNHRMYNLYTKFVKILEICKQFSENLANESDNVPCVWSMNRVAFHAVVLFKSLLTWKCAKTCNTLICHTSTILQ